MLSFFSMITTLGNVPVVVAVCALFFFCMYVLHRRPLVFTFLGATIFGTFVAWSVKIIVDRPRPFSSFLLEAEGPAFPSAHALLSVVVYGLIGFYLYHYFKSWYVKGIGIFVAVVIPFLVGLSRVYLGVHWVSDVVAGWGMGFVIVWLSIRHISRVEKWYTSH